MIRFARFLFFALALAAAPAMAQDDSPLFWRPAETPPGGVSWQILESTKLISRLHENRVVVSKPEFPEAVKALDGKEVKVAGWMMPLENGNMQRHFILFGYPPGCPYHEHATPNQFIEVMADVPVPVEEIDSIILTGVLELGGYNEEGVFYRLLKARAE